MSKEKQHMDDPQIKKEESETEIEKENIDNIEKTYAIIGGTIGFVVGILISFNAIFAMQIGIFLGLILETRKKRNNTILTRSCYAELEKPDNQNNSAQCCNN